MFLYKYVLNGKIVYIGKTTRPIIKRIKEHEYKKDIPPGCDIYVFRCDNEANMNALELLLIDKYRPKYNTDCVSAGFERSTLEFVEPEFELYSEFAKSRVPINYFRSNKGRVMAYMSDGTSQRPSFCKCDTSSPFPELQDNDCVISFCALCGLPIKNTFHELNM